MKRERDGCPYQHSPADRALLLQADPLRLTQVVTNLLTNAANYTDPEGRMVLESRIEARTIVIHVREGWSNYTEEGVEARSAGLERGSEFMVCFPNALIEAAPRPQPAGDGGAPPSRARPLRVLVADDNRDGAESLGMLLELSGHEVHLAHDGVDALALAAAKLPDVALLDIGMPGMDGYEVAAKIRRESWGSNLTLIAITGWGQEDNKRMARSAGFDHHLTKPMDSKELESILATVVPAS